LLLGAFVNARTIVFALRHYNRGMPRLSLVCRWFAVLGVCFAGWIPLAAEAGTPTLQTAVMHAMAGRRGAAVVVDVRLGHVLAAYHLDVAARCVVHPGSSIKPFTLLALLQAGKLDAHTALMCKRTVSIGGRKLDCTHPATPEPLVPASALAYSCNSYFTSAATRLTPTQLRDSLVRSGFSSPTGLSRDEAAGNTVLSHSLEELQLQSIGEWGISVTPLELLHGYLDLARLAQSDPNGKLSPILEGLQQSVTYGMGRVAQPTGAMKVAGKTGTAIADEGPWTHAWFAGYAPAQNPEIVLVVFLEQGHGGADAAAVAREIFAAFAANRVARVAETVKGAQR
jgi:cell division protein FtsI/penicillin-binding protein 2